MKRIAVLLLVAALLSLYPYALGETGQPNIVCTDFPCYDFARSVVGDSSTITLLIHPGAEVHSYEPSPSDVRAIAECDLFIYIGGESDAWVDDILSSFGTAAPKTLRLIDCVQALEEEMQEGMTVHEHADNETETEYDEHIWTSPVNAGIMVGAICETLCAVSPENRESYIGNADSYKDEIAAIDTEFREIADNAARHEMIFADRFPFLYFVREYGIDYYAAFPSCSAESEPSAKTMAYLIDKIKDDDIPVIYTIEMSNQRTAKVIAEETGAKIRTFYSIQNVSAADFAAGETYVSLMRKNVEALREGLN